MSKKILYFAYGSNMLTTRMRDRVSSAVVIHRAKLLNKRIVCNKISQDGSGKANLIDDVEGEVWGVIYEINREDLQKLDRFELGYDRLSINVWTEEESTISVQVYISSKVANDLLPFEWYKDLIVQGSREHNLPPGYIEYLQSLPSKPNPVATV